jgi:antitoxin (DNA-binding transcriptional repressor) of toxin-antitoxin stability system
MKTISIAELKSRLSAELKLVGAGEVLLVTDHKHPVAYVSPLPGELEYSRRAKKAYSYRPLARLMKSDPLDYLDEERGEL